MIEKSVAETKWCPFALVQSDVAERDFSGEWRDRRIGSATTQYSTNGKMIAITVINRTTAGEKHPDCLCITDKCVWWRQLNTTYGDCARLNDNIQSFGSDDDDSKMIAQWCPLARPEDAPVTRPWNGTISGETIAIASPNRVAGNQMHPSSKCITKECMAYVAGKVDAGYCMAADKNMQR